MSQTDTNKRDLASVIGEIREEGFDDPSLECDVIMKGGITSGVVYPLTVCKLATRYRLRSVGGASATLLESSMYLDSRKIKPKDNDYYSDYTPK